MAFCDSSTGDGCLDNVSLSSNGTKGVQVTFGQILGLSTLFCVIGLVGIIGNLMVIYIIFSDLKMRKSMTNMLIVNLAVADILIMVLGIPDIVQFMINNGWIIGPVLCKTLRAFLVASLYVSVLTLVALCVERYIAIVYPIKAHIMCTKRRTAFVILLIWITSFMCAAPTFVFNIVAPPEPLANVEFCMLIFPDGHIVYFIIYKYSECVLFYVIPMLIQLICYVIIGKKLFVGVETLYRRTLVKNEEGQEKEKTSDAIRARRGVVKMLVASVGIYFLSYSPHQVLLVYNTVSPAPFHQTWTFLVFVTSLAYINSAANPVIYCIFSENFRRKFKHILICRKRVNETSQSGTANTNTEYITMTKKPTNYNATQVHL